MKRMILFFAVLLMAVPAVGQETFVTLDCVKDANEVIVSYLVTGTDHLVRAFGLDIEVTDANITKMVPVDANYRIYPGQIEIENGEITDYNYPYEQDDLGDANLAIEMGSLYTLDSNHAGDANAGYGMQPGQSGILFKFYCDDNTFTYSVTENTARGGIVMEDPCEEPNVTLCEPAITCPVPDVVGDPNLEAQATIVAANLTVGAITSAYSDTVPYDDVISQEPVGGSEVTCGSDVNLVISRGSDCYVGIADHDQWTAAGRPICWCYPRQCHGDADGQKEGVPVAGYHYVGQGDLDIMALGWLDKDPPKGSGILGLEVNGVPVACADFKHDREGVPVAGYHRVGQNDLDEMALYWLEKEPPKGSGTPDDCCSDVDPSKPDCRNP